MFQTLLPLTKRNSYSGTRHYWENSRMQMWGWSTPLHQRPRQITLKGWEKWLHVDHTANPPGQCSTMWSSLPWSSSSSTGKRDLGRHPDYAPELWVILQEPLVWSHTKKTSGDICGAQPWRIWLWQKEIKVCNN